ncbi:hypothetical protein SAMN05660776_2160 [Salegentibacter holothuriorum]|uniref:O-antigen ligase like membrane protein n=1 Tax=Salegentibacter holothuriorum TaxID=241145 RepID=A0A1T5CRT8_9FLAO|nr:hypothetical protein SAMN05660776_2160 [Salegentibacter holothuriorum]
MEKILKPFLQTTYRERELVNLMWIGFLLYILSYTLSTTTYVNYVICQFIQIVGLVLFIPLFFNLIKFRLVNTYLQVFFSLYIIWIIFIVIRDFPSNFDQLKFMLFDAWFGGILYLSPLFILLPLKLFYLKKLFQTIFLLAIAYLIYDVFFLKDLLSQGASLTSLNIVEYFSKTLAVPAFFLLMVYTYHSNRKKFFLIIILLVTIFFALVRARRGLLFMCGLTAVFSYLLFLSQTRNKFFLVLLTIICGGILFIFGLEFFSYQKHSIFDHITDRGLEDTRSTVEICFFQDLSFKDWIIGKGMLGEYFCPGIDQDDVTGYRSTIETDYLQIILKGGLMSLSLFLLITIPAIFKGLFYSTNLLSKAAALWIIWILLNMYPSTIHTFTMPYILLWISVGICYSKNIRNIPNETLISYFKEEANSDLKQPTVNL